MIAILSTISVAERGAIHRRQEDANRRRAAERCAWSLPGAQERGAVAFNEAVMHGKVNVNAEEMAKCLSPECDRLHLKPSGSWSLRV